MSIQPKALQIADVLDSCSANEETTLDAAAELRRQHELIGVLGYALHQIITADDFQAMTQPHIEFGRAALNRMKKEQA